MTIQGDEAAVAFFRDQAGYATPPGQEECARRIAAAERWLMEQPGHTVEWVQDRDYDPADCDVPDMPEIGWVCCVTVGKERASLCGITFGGDGHPGGDPYARVVVAELASELMPD